LKTWPHAGDNEGGEMNKH